MIKSQDEIDKWVKDAVNADIVMMIPVNDSYQGFKFGSAYIQSLLPDKVKFISYPNYHLEIFYPFFGYAKNSRGQTIRGYEVAEHGHQYGDYHDFLGLALSLRGKASQEQFYKIINDVDKQESFESRIINRSALLSFNEFKIRYPAYIEIIEQNMGKRTDHTFNHPSPAFLNEVYKLIWVRDLGLKMCDFIDFTEDRLGDIVLPIPSFVSKSILNKTIDMPWSENIDNNYNSIRQDISVYVEKLKCSVSFYDACPQIVECNKNHPKMNSAISFLDEVRA